MPGPSTYLARSDRSVVTLPTLPTLGPAGSTLVDPSFGTRILRVTDSLAIDGFPTSYRTLGVVRAWNSNSTRFCVQTTGSSCIPFSFDAATMTRARLPGGLPGEGGLILKFTAMVGFSLIDPDVIYGLDTRIAHPVISSYNFATQAYATVADVNAIVPGISTDNDPGRTYLRGLATGTPNGSTEYMSFIFGGAGQDADYLCAWFQVGNLGARKLLNSQASTINGVATNITLGIFLHYGVMDQSGRYVILGTTTAGITAGKASEYIWDTQTDLIAPLSGGGHGCIGYGDSINMPNDTGRMEAVYRTFALPNATRNLVSPLMSIQDTNASTHMSWANASAAALLPAFAETYRYPTLDVDGITWIPDPNARHEWDEEIIAIETDPAGQNRVWRFCHHRSETDQRTDADVSRDQWFYYTPRVDVSTDGRFCLFESNWGKTLGRDPSGQSSRTDVFMVECSSSGSGGPAQATHRHHGKFRHA